MQEILIMMPFCIVGVLILYFLIIRPLLALGEIPYEIHKLRDELMAQKSKKDGEDKSQVQEKTGHWIDDADKIDAQFGKHTYKCSECGKYAEYFVSGTEVWWDRIKPNFCSNCGARMFEPQESKDKEE